MSTLRRLLRTFDTSDPLLDVPPDACIVLGEALRFVGCVGNRCTVTWTTFKSHVKGTVISSFPRLKAADNQYSKKNKQQVSVLLAYEGVRCAEYRASEGNPESHSTAIICLHIWFG